MKKSTQQPRKAAKQRKAPTFTTRFPELVSAIKGTDSAFAKSSIGHKLITGVMKAQTAK